MLVVSAEGAAKFAAAMSTAKIIAVDTETTNNVETEKVTSIASLWDGRNWLMGVSASFFYQDEIWSAYFPLRHETGNMPREAFGPVQTVLESSTLVFHNAPFDIASLASIAITPRGDIYDSLVMAHMVNEEFPSKELAWLCKTILKVDTKEKDRVAQWAKIWGWNSIPPEIMTERACFDTENTLRLFKVFFTEMAA